MYIPQIYLKIFPKFVDINLKKKTNQYYIANFLVISFII